MTERFTLADELAPRVARTQLTVGVLAVVVGLIGFWIARGVEFSGGPGATIFEDFELRTMSYNGLGAVVTVVLGACGIAAGILRRPIIALVGGIGFALVAVQPLLQWRSGATNLLGANGRNIGWSLALAFGLIVPALVARLAASDSSPSSESEDATH